MPDTPDESRSPVTGLLHAWGRGDPAALNALIPLVHDELRRLARRRLARERPGHTLQPTALVNEAYLRLAKERGIQWNDRAHFLAVAAQLMRFILVDHGRKRRNLKRGGAAPHVQLDVDIIDARAGDVVAIDQALNDLARVDARKARVAEMRLFGGLSAEESARLLDVSVETVGRD